MPAPFDEKLVRKLQDKDYRAAYAEDVVRVGIALQIRALREQRGCSQAELGRKMGKPQSVVSRLEDPDYGRLTLQTLFEVGEAFDLPVLVQIVEWEEFLRRTADVSRPALEKKSFDFQRLLGTALIPGHADKGSLETRQTHSKKPPESLQPVLSGQPAYRTQGGGDVFIATGYSTSVSAGRSSTREAATSVPPVGQALRREQGPGLPQWS